jgi:hypothetical protein
LCQGQRSKVKRTLALQLLKTLLYLLETKEASAKNAWRGVRGGSAPLKIETFFFFFKSLYMVETRIAGAKNVWRGVRGGHPPAKSCKKILLPSTVEG